MPELGGAAWMMTAFSHLDTCRSLGMSVGHIPATAIFTYADRYGLGEDFIDGMYTIDRHYIRGINGKTTKTSSDGVPQTGGGKHGQRPNV